MAKRFRDEQLRLSDFYTEVWVECPGCTRRATARADFRMKCARLLCANCGYCREEKIYFNCAAHHYFGAALWLCQSFRGNVFYAYNDAHLDYLERYIKADLREHHNRTHFTLLEKLPLFYHKARNRQPLLKLIQQLRTR